MKKTLLVALGCILTVGANAQTLKPTGRVLNNTNFFSLASQYTINNKSILYVECEDGYEIWGDDLAVERTIVIPLGVSEERYVTEQKDETGQWVQSTEFSSWNDDLVEWWAMINADKGEYSDNLVSGGVLTQTLFNNDAEMEYIRRKFEDVVYRYQEQDRDGDGEIDYKYTIYRNKTVGFEIVNESGEVLSYIPVVNYRNISYLDCIILKFREEHYLLAENCRQTVDGEEGWDGMDYVYFYDVYVIDKSANSIKKVKSTSPIHVNPTVAERNTIINVTLGEAQTESGGELIVTDSNGRMVNRHRVEVGQKQVPVLLEGVSSGVYNVTLNQKGENVENARIIVK